MKPMDPSQLVSRFYTEALTVNRKTTPTAVFEQILAPSFQSVNSQEVKDRATLSNQIEGIWKGIPNLVWAIQDIVVSHDGAKVVVRSVATGTPKGMFMGMDLPGTKSFKMDTIDIHEVKDGKIARVHHLEDWATAMKQLNA